MLSHIKLDIVIVRDTWGSELITNIKTCFAELEVNFHKDISIVTT